MRPVFKRIDTCAAEFASPTAYMYSTYAAPFAGAPANEAQRRPTSKKVVILGGGPNRIGQGIEFDYCCCHAAFALKDAGYETIMINCNPETVSTDYDTSDRLYFEPLTAEDVIEIIDTERSAAARLHGVIVQFGGQTPLKLAEPLEKANVPILGTSPDAIDLAEDRNRFKHLLDTLGSSSRMNGIATSPKQAQLVAAEHRLSDRDPAVLRARRPRHGDRPRGAAARPLPRPCRLSADLERAVRTGGIQANARCCSTAISATPSRSMSTALPMARIPSSPASWSISRRPASIPAIRRARCRRIPFKPKMIAELDRQTRELALALRSAG